MVYVIYNPRANNGNIKIDYAKLADAFPGNEMHICPVDEIEPYTAFFEALAPEDIAIFAGGDGTLNYLANQIRRVELHNPVYFCKAGTGNDFLRDVCDKKPEDGTLVPLNDYLRDLPVVTINGEEHVFLNNVAFGLDGWVCAAGLEAAAKGKGTDYTALAIKGLLTYRCPNAKITVDGVTREYKKVWLAPAMNGRFYGGGMMIAPDQDRTGDTLTSLVWYGAGRLLTLLIFPSIFKGTHTKRKKHLSILNGHTITVEYDRPTDLQIDGEVFRNVTRFTAVKPARVAAAAKE